MLFLELLAERPMRAKELADATGAKWTTAHRTLAYLREKGYVERDEVSGLHYVGRRLFSIGVSYVNEHPLLNAGRSLLRSAADETRGFVQIAERDGGHSVALASVEPRTPPPTSALTYSMLGRRYPLHTGARGHVLLAYSDPEFIEEYLDRPLAALTEHSITDPSRLREVLEKTREQGFAVTMQDVTLASVSEAAPIRSANDGVIAAAAIINYHDDRNHAQDNTRAVVELARSVSHLAGWRLH